MRALIVDDHALFAEGMRLLLQGSSLVEDVMSRHTGEQALALAQSTEFDLVLLDWNFNGGLGGGDLLAALKLALPLSRLVVVSGDSSADVIRAAIDGGAVGFVPKESSPALLIDALRMTAHGGIYLPRAVLDDASAPGAARSELQTIADAFPGLTARHRDVLDHVARGMSNKQIGRLLGISDGTVKQHLNAIFRELGVASRTEAVYLMARKGVRFL